jgi:three-Cys-motif partner protein
MGKKNQSNWPDLLSQVEVDDGLPTRETGPWSFDKLWWWNRYIGITTRAMVGKPHWSELVYVDLFAGPGICESRIDRQRFPGSPLIAALAPKPFGRLLLCEAELELANACKSRLAHFGADFRTTVFHGDCNERIADICAAIPDRALTLAFIDPTGLHAEFETVRTLTENRRVDLFILFADNMDIVRNVALYASQDESNLDRVLGPDCDWRSAWRNLDNHNPSNVARLFVELYKRQLADKLGYTYSADEPIKNSKNTPIYRLVFASKSQMGLDFWQKTASKERLGNRLF